MHVRRVIFKRASARRFSPEESSPTRGSYVRVTHLRTCNLQKYATVAARCLQGETAACIPGGVAARAPFTCDGNVSLHPYSPTPVSRLVHVAALMPLRDLLDRCLLAFRHRCAGFFLPGAWCPPSVPRSLKVCECTYCNRIGIYYCHNRRLDNSSYLCLCQRYNYLWCDSINHARRIVHPRAECSDNDI